MNYFLYDEARQDIKKMDRAQRLLFNEHFNKIVKNPSNKHLKHGLPFFKENVGQGRIIYQIEDDIVYIIRCFTTHKDYEKWYRS